MNNLRQIHSEIGPEERTEPFRVTPLGGLMKVLGQGDVTLTTNKQTDEERDGGRV